MKTVFALFAFCAVLGLGLSAMAKDAPADTTVKGTMKCAKCSLKEADKCQAVLVTKEADKEVKYYLQDNATGKAAHKEICKADKENVSVTGKVTEKEGKKMIAATKVE